jgi:hypothetical protein
MMDGELQWVYVIVGLVVVVSVVIPAIVPGLAQRIASGDVPETLMGKRTRTARETTTGHAIMAQQATRHETRTDPALARIGAVAALVGAVLFFLSGLLHPSTSAPSDLPAAFAEYARSSYWVAIHLGQFVGVALMGIALVALGATLESGRPAAWARIGLAGVAASIAVYAANQAVDGVSNHVMVHRLAAATGETRALVFEAAFAVRQIEVGLTSYFSLLFGATLVTFGLAMLLSARYPNWLAAVGLLGGLGAVVIGLEQSSNGFSDLALNLFMILGVVDLIWVSLTGVFMWRLAPHLAGDREAA